MLIVAGCAAPAPSPAPHPPSAPDPPEAERVPADWQQREAKEFAALLSEWQPDSPLRLRPSCACRLDAATVLVGGDYARPAAALRSALLRSTDNGASWSDTGVWLSGSSVLAIEAVDSTHAWALVCWSIESSGPPVVVFATRDGGRSWTRSQRDLPFTEIGTLDVAQLDFSDTEHGQLVIKGSSSPRIHYNTSDGGTTWTQSSVEPSDFGADSVKASADDRGIVHLRDISDGGDALLGTIPGAPIPVPAQSPRR